MSRETLEHLNTNTLIGFADKRGTAWHYKAELQGDEPNHYPGAIPVADVRRRLFDWEAESWEVLFRNPVTGEIIKDPDRQGIIHSRAKTVLGVFTDGYKRHQYNQWLIDNVGVLLDDELHLASAGQLKGGAVAWVQVELPDSFEISGTGVEYRPNLLAATSFDGSLSTTYKRTVTNVVCDNTMAAGLAEKGQQIKIRHSKNSIGKVIEAREALNLVLAAADDFEEQVKALLATEVNAKDFTRFVDAWSPIPAEGAHKASITRAEGKRDEITRLWKADPRVAPWTGTGWGVVQAVNTYAHHSQSVRGGSRVERNMLRAVNGDVDALDAGTVKLLHQVLDSGTNPSKNRYGLAV